MSLFRAIVNGRIAQDLKGRQSTTAGLRGAVARRVGDWRAAARVFTACLRLAPGQSRGHIQQQCNRCPPQAYQ
jgi:hypothetical protein